MLASQGMSFLVAGEIPERLGSAHPSIVPYQSFPTLNGELFIAVGNDMQFRRFSEIAAANWADDARFASNALRVANRHLLVPMIAERMRTRSKAEWRRTLDDAGIPCGPVQDLEEVFNDPQVSARGLRFDLPHTRCIPICRRSPTRCASTDICIMRGSRHRCVENTHTRCCLNSATTKR